MGVFDGRFGLFEVEMLVKRWLCIGKQQFLSNAATYNSIKTVSEILISFFRKHKSGVSGEL
jgi:hypothetical protein